MSGRSAFTSRRLQNKVLWRSCSFEVHGMAGQGPSPRTGGQFVVRKSPKSVDGTKVGSRKQVCWQRWVFES